MDYRVVNADNTKNVNQETRDLEWQVDSDWINLTTSQNSTKEANYNSPFPSTARNNNFHFIPSSKGGKFLIIDHQTLRLSQKLSSGYSHWVCNIPCCNAQCILDPDEKNVKRYFGEHNHEQQISRVVYRDFINALKKSVKENPHVKPEIIYDAEVKRIKHEWAEGIRRNAKDEMSLPHYEDVQTAMYNTRQAVLSTFSLKPAEGSEQPASTKSTNPAGKKKTASQNQDGEDLEGIWATHAHKDASLSDFEDWLEEDVATNATPRPKQSKAKRENADLDTSLDNEEDLWNATIPLEKIPRRKYRKRPASMSVFTCPHCPYKSNRHFNVQRHERLAHSSKKPEYSCKECGTSYSLEYRLKLHIKAVHQGEGHHCHICSRTFETMTGLKSHLMTKHKNEDTNAVRELPLELTCKLCCRVFTTKTHLVKHMSTHVMVQPYRCYTCNQPFMDESQWLTHQNNCVDAFTIQCCLCSSVIPTAHDLLVHMDQAHGRSEYPCSCGKSFPWKKSLLTHQQKCAFYMSEKVSAPYMSEKVSIPYMLEKIPVS